MKPNLLIATILIPLLGQSTALANHEIKAGDKYSYSLGSGYHSDTQLPKPHCLFGKQISSGKASSDVEFRQTVDRTQLASELGVDVAARAQMGAAKVSAEANFLQSSASDDFSLTMNYKGNYRFKNLELANYEKGQNHTDLYKQLQKKGAQFEDKCGDEFIYQIGQGANLYFSIRIDFVSKADRDMFHAKGTYDASLASASLAIKQQSSRVSQQTRVTVSALQIGGDVSQITGIFGARTADSTAALGFVQCTLGDFKQCDAVLASAIDYAANTATGFPSQLKAGKDDVNHSGSDIFYETMSYKDIGIDIPPPIVTDAIAKAIVRVNEIYKPTAEKLDRARNILRGVALLSERQRTALAKEEVKLSANHDAIIDAATACFDHPDSCLQAEKGLHLASIDELAFVINPESFAQFCQMSESPTATAELKNTMAALIQAAKDLDASKFVSVSATIPVDQCAVTEAILHTVKALNLSGKKIATIEPLVDFPNIQKLDLADNEIEDLKPIAKLTGLQSLDIRNNRLHDVVDVATLPNITELDVAGNFITDASGLSQSKSLVRVDLRQNVVALECPKAPNLKACSNGSHTFDIKFAAAGHLGPNNMMFASADQLADGRTVIAGVSIGLSSYEEIGLFDPQTARIDYFSSSQGRILNSTTALLDGRVLLAGGIGLKGDELDVVNFADQTVSPLPLRLQQKRFGHTATLLADGRVLLAGGFAGTDDPQNVASLQSAEIFDPKRMTTKSVMMNELRAGHTATKLADGRVVLIGGSTSTGPLRTIEIFNPTDDSFTLVKAVMPTGRALHTATLMANGEILLAGGLGANNRVLSSLEIFNPGSGESRPLMAELRIARASHSATVLSNGKILLIGGVSKKGNKPTWGFFDLDDVMTPTGEVFDPNTQALDDITGSITPRVNPILLRADHEVYYILGSTTLGISDVMDSVSYQEH